MNAKLEQRAKFKKLREGRVRRKEEVKGGPVLVTTKRYIYYTNFFNILFFTFIKKNVDSSSHNTYHSMATYEIVEN